MQISGVSIFFLENSKVSHNYTLLSTSARTAPVSMQKTHEANVIQKMSMKKCVCVCVHIEYNIDTFVLPQQCLSNRSACKHM